MGDGFDEDEDEEDEMNKLVEGRTLDGFVHKYTSEDNFAASELMLKDAVALEQQRSVSYRIPSKRRLITKSRDVGHPR